MDLVILNQGQVTRTTAELATPSPKFPTTPAGGNLSLDLLNVHLPPLHDGSSEQHRARTHDTPAASPLPLPLGYRSNIRLR
ncbi:hypothetical protein TNCV_228511 [Trichonephila clavipes]|nr:hypothetical protein TNCV_228511 [Trichonephila clavipes]